MMALKINYDALCQSLTDRAIALRQNGEGRDAQRMEQAVIAIEQLRWQADGLQATLDRLMLEYCPKEMTAEQIANWEANQTPVTAEQQADIERALASNPKFAVTDSIDGPTEPLV